MSAKLVCTGQREPGLANRLDFEREMDQRPILVRSRDRTYPQRLRRTAAEDYPLPASGADEAPRRVDKIAHDTCPRAEANRAKAARQSAESSN